MCIRDRGSALADHIHHDASVGEDLQITCHRVALELGILYTDHHFLIFIIFAIVLLFEFQQEQK